MSFGVHNSLQRDQLLAVTIRFRGVSYWRSQFVSEGSSIDVHNSFQRGSVTCGVHNFISERSAIGVHNHFSRVCLKRTARPLGRNDEHKGYISGIKSQS